MLLHFIPALNNIYTVLNKCRTNTESFLLFVSGNRVQHSSNNIISVQVYLQIIKLDSEIYFNIFFSFNFFKL